MNRLRTLFGTEPAVVSGVIAAAIALAISFGLNWSTDQVALVMAAVTALLGAYTAWVTSHTLLSSLVGVAKALLALAVGFGFKLSPDQTGAIIAFITIALSLFNRTQNGPVSAGRGYMGNTVKG